MLGCKQRILARGGRAELSTVTFARILEYWRIRRRTLEDRRLEDLRLKDQTEHWRLEGLMDQKHITETVQGSFHSLVAHGAGGYDL